MSMSNLSLLNPWIGAIAIIAVVLISVIIQLISNRWFADEDFDNIHNVGGIYMSAVATLYSVILGMILVNSSQSFIEAKKNIQDESESLLEVLYYSRSMPDKYQSGVTSSISRYVDYLVENYSNEKESDMFYEKDHHVYPVTRFIDIADSVKKIEPETENQKATYPAMLESIKSANENRRARLEINDYKITWIEWFCLISGGIVIIVFSLFFTIRHRVAHAVTTGMVAFVVATNLYAVYMLNNPYSRFIDIPTSRLEFLRDWIKEVQINEQELKNRSQQTESETNHPSLPERPHHSFPSSSQSR